MKQLALDCETNGLDPSIVWVVVTRDILSGAVVVHKDAYSLAEELKDTDEVIGHNVIAYDVPVLERLWAIDFSVIKITDTLIMSRLENPSRDGGHSLRAWGDRLGFPKGEYNDWEGGLTTEMVQYCIQDVKVTERLYQHLLNHLEPYGSDSITLEHEVQTVISNQVANGWLFDTRRAFNLLGQLKERKLQLERDVHARFRPIAQKVKEVTPKVKKDGTFSVVGLKFLGDDWAQVWGPFSRVEWPEFNLGSRQQIGVYLKRFGWKPKKFTDTGQPIVDEKTLEGVEVPEAKLIAEYLMIQKRIAQVESWVDATKDDGRIHGSVNTMGAVTFRMTHMEPNVAQTPANDVPYGEECRSCWIVPEGYKLVGADASGLELRMLAHYMGDPEYTRQLLEEDIHTVNQKAAELPTRAQAKTMIYSVLYGGGDARVGSIVGAGASKGRQIKKRFLDNTPALKNLRERVDKACRKGYLKGLDGRRVRVRSPHSALNTLLQSAGAIVMKRALIILVEYADKWSLDYKFVNNCHDEWEAEVLEKDAESFAHLSVQAIRASGIYYNLKCPLDAEAHIGNNWSEVH